MAEFFSAQVSVRRKKQIDSTPEKAGKAVCCNNGYDIKFQDVVISYNEETVLNGVSFTAKQHSGRTYGEKWPFCIYGGITVETIDKNA